MRISQGFSNQISKVNTIFCSEKAELYMFMKKINYFASQNRKGA